MNLMEFSVSINILMVKIKGAVVQSFLIVSRTSMTLKFVTRF